MSGPIVRKYGFPNFEKIFGERTSSARCGRVGASRRRAQTGGYRQTEKSARPNRKPRSRRNLSL